MQNSKEKDPPHDSEVPVIEEELRVQDSFLISGVLDTDLEVQDLNPNQEVRDTDLHLEVLDIDPHPEVPDPDQDLETQDIDPHPEVPDPDQDLETQDFIQDQKDLVIEVEI